ncbi:hypothetical protein [Streptomyces lavendulocolor]|uniref:hypothetical protein n=1 Tax=Streptomyces lavendulocolor TaxID=67316 RepID=UPI003C2B24DF
MNDGWVNVDSARPEMTSRTDEEQPGEEEFRGPTHRTVRGRARALSSPLNKGNRNVKKKCIRVAAAAALTAVAVGAAAPLAQAAEAQRQQAAGEVVEESLRPTAADVRDLVARMRKDGADPALVAEFERYAGRLENPDAHQRTKRALGMGTIVRKLVVAGLRHGGVWAGKIIGKVSKKSGAFISRNGNKIADAIEDVEGWSETALTVAMVRAGIPTDVAHDIARAIMLVAL